MEINTVELLKVLADPIRFTIVKRLYNKCELCACNILDDFEIAQPTLSFHMKKLTSCGLVNVRKDGIWMKYSVNTEVYEQLIKEINFPQNQTEAMNCTNILE